VNAHVQASGYPWWQPLDWLSRPAPDRWHPGVFLVAFPDRLLLVAAVLSVPVAWRRRPVWVVWSVMGLAFLLAWPTKWPQYTLLLRAGLAGCAGLGVSALAGWLAALVASRRPGRRGHALG
jgi:chromate transport protein ChrA